MKGSPECYKRMLKVIKLDPREERWSSQLPETGGRTGPETRENHVSPELLRKFAVGSKVLLIHGKALQ